MQTAPRTASAARRCSGFSPSRTPTPPRYRAVLTAAVPKKELLVQRVLERAGRLVVGLSPLFPRDRPEPRHDLERLARVGEAFEGADLLLDPFPVDGRPGGAQDLRVARRGDLLLLRPQLFVQLLARAHADVVDRDLRVGLLAGQADHVARKVDDLHGV